VTDASNVNVAVTGAVYVAAVADVAQTGTTGSLVVSVNAPTDADTALTSVWTAVGYISEDGVKEANDTENEEIKAWQNSDIVRKMITKNETSYAFTMIETNAQALSLFYGKAIAAADIKHTIGGSLTGKIAVVIDAIDGTQVIRRYIPSAEVTERGEVSLTSSDATGYEVTVTAYPDAVIGGSVEVHYKEALK
jgi:hypothetical protein